MRLIGMLDSPYVRRVAISMHAMGFSFMHEPLSVFRDFDAFAAINPVVKAPTLVLDDGTVLLDSTLILEVLATLVEPARRLTPEEPGAVLTDQRAIGLALAACEKSVQMAYELNLRPADKQHQPWLDRVERQLGAAYEQLNTAFSGTDGWLFGARPLQADITAAVAWRFTQRMLPGTVPDTRFPALAALSRRAEATPVFQAYPHD